MFRIWPLYIKFVSMHNIPETAIRVFRRHLQMYPDNSEQYISYLVSVDKLDEASQVSFYRGPSMNNDNDNRGPYSLAINNKWSINHE